MNAELLIRALAAREVRAGGLSLSYLALVAAV